MLHGSRLHFHLYCIAAETQSRTTICEALQQGLKIALLGRLELSKRGPMVWYGLVLGDVLV